MIKERVLAGLVPELARIVDEFWACDYAEKCESEIERAFAAALLLPTHFNNKQITSRRDGCSKTGSPLFLEPQYEIGEYRVDFLLGTYLGAVELTKCVAIECDGHAFHDKTKEQAARDKSRDRYLSGCVGRVIRFTGSEIYRDPSACAIEALKILHVAELGVGYEAP